MLKINKYLSLFIVANIWGILYIFWRAVYTINYLGDKASLVWSILLLFAEFYSFLVFISFSIAVIRKDDYKLPVGNSAPLNYEELPTVDVFICTLNEGKKIVRPTIAAALNIDYPKKKVYLLDDGRRPEMFELAKTLGCHYIARDTNIGYKAGNLNNALRQTDGELVLVLDADHVPVSTILNELVGSFHDEKVALVQTPQHFFNLDPFQKNLHFEKFVTNEQDLFYRIIEPGLSCWNSTICGGTNFVVRRKYVDEVGGFPEDTITEDFALSLKLESRKYKILYYNKPLCSGISTDTFREYVKQRSRWARGNLSVILNLKNLWSFVKLTPVQLFLKIMGVSYFLYPFARLIFLFSPIMFIFFNFTPLVAIIYHLFSFQVVYFAFKVWFFNSTAKKYRHFLFTDVYESATCPFLAIDLVKFFFVPSFLKKKTEFIVTDKASYRDKAKLNLQFFIPLFLITLVLLAGEVKAIVDLYNTPANPGAIAVNIFWNTYNLLLMMYALRVTVDKPEFRKNIRVPVRHEVVLFNRNEEYKVFTVNISETGSLLSTWELIPREFFDDTHIIFPNCEEIKVSLVQAISARYEFLYRVKIHSVETSDFFIKNMFSNSDTWDKVKDESACKETVSLRRSIR